MEFHNAVSHDGEMGDGNFLIESASIYVEGISSAGFNYLELKVAACVMLFYVSQMTRGIWHFSYNSSSRRYALERNYVPLSLIVLYIPVRRALQLRLLRVVFNYRYKEKRSECSGKNLASSTEPLLARYISTAESAPMHRSAYRDLYTWSDLITRYAWITRHRAPRGHKYSPLPGVINIGEN